MRFHGDGLSFSERNEIVNNAVNAAINRALESEENLHLLTLQLAEFASKENKPRRYADQSITAEVLSNRSSFKEEMTGLLRLKEERCDSKFVSGDDRPSLPIIDGPTALAETLEQLPRGASLVLCTSID